MIGPSKLYDGFRIPFTGTADELAAIPDSIYTVTEGDLWYDTTNSVMKYYNGTAWTDLDTTE